MKKRAKAIDGRKLVERLTPEPAHGPLVGLLATSYEMQAPFLETDFIPSVFGLGAWDDRSWSSRVAVERALASLDAAVVLMDARPYTDRPRTLRVELVPAIGPQGQLLHAKILLLVHERAVRLLVSSANLTQPGYRENREVALALTATEEQPGHGSLIRDALAPMAELLAAWWTEGASRVVARAQERLAEWTLPASLPGAIFAWSGGAVRLWQQFLDQWPDGEPVEALHIVSPFWSEEKGGDGPVSTLLGELQRRRVLAPGAKLRLLTEARPTTATEYRPELPASFADFDPRSFGIEAWAHAVDPRVTREEIEREDFARLRPLHAKIVLLQGPKTSLAYVGSANFSRHGWGFLEPGMGIANLEAGVILRQIGSERAALDSLLPATIGASVPLDGAASTKLAVAAPPTPPAPWPTFLAHVLLRPVAGQSDRLELAISVDPERVDGAFTLSIPKEEGLPLLEQAERSASREFILALSPERLRALLIAQAVEVRWWASPESRMYPVNVELAARMALPMSPGDARPDERLLLAYYQGRIRFEDVFPRPPEFAEVDEDEPVLAPPPSAVDTSRIQSYQVREFVEALQGIRDDLKNAVRSEPAARMALMGPVSPVALARQIHEAVHKGKRSPTAGGFQLVELLSCLWEARGLDVPAKNRECWIALVDEAVAQVDLLLVQLETLHPGDLGPQKRAYRRFKTELRRFHGI